jgi:hypothetical protein
MHVRIAGFVFAVAATASAHALQQRPGRLLDCESTFPVQLTAATLEEKYGSEELGSGEIYTGEGRFHPVTILFPKSAEDRVEIVWRDQERKRSPAQVWIRGERSRWRTRTGLTVGMDLRSVERLNRRPFTLTGFHWDYAGTVMSWRDGRLSAAESSACRVRAVFVEPAIDSPVSRQLLGDRNFSSGHPAMQALNPRIEQLWLEYP